MSRVKLLGLHGAPRSGRDTAANLLSDYLRCSLADRVQEALLRQNPRVAGSMRIADVVDLFGWTIARRHQVYGEEVTRLLGETKDMASEFFGADVWVRRLERVLHERVIREQPFGIVVTDITNPVEADWVHERGGLVCAITRPGFEAAYALPPELVDLDVRNDGTLDDLAAAVAAMTGNTQPTGPALPLRHRVTVQR